jgi:hypothetical protein
MGERDRLCTGGRGGVRESTEAEDRRKQHEGEWTHIVLHRRRNPAHKENLYMFMLLLLSLGK